MYSRKIGYSKRASFNRYRMMLELAGGAFDSENFRINNKKTKPRLKRKKLKRVRK